MPVHVTRRRPSQVSISSQKAGGSLSSLHNLEQLFADEQAEQQQQQQDVKACGSAERSTSQLCLARRASLHRLPSSGVTSLHSGSVFRGKQISEKLSYDVTVELKHVDLEASTLSGYLHIDGLTQEHPRLTTFFEAEIIGERYDFMTRKWDADAEVDREHWGRFPAFDANELDDDEKNLRSGMSMTAAERAREGGAVFMRWKECFLVPDHKLTGVAGASFAGFYYICFDPAQNRISGLYYHQRTEWWQRLELTHVPQRTSEAFELR